ncbi:hypothetical protein HZR84_07195 [Hyphobacterium sp. CCMP332]|nr:hypothetical protein HZR84_07195 [Hyphobacterium sp. CCMP332]
MKFLLAFVCLVIAVSQSLAQIQVNYNWGSSKEAVKEAKSDLLISESDGLLKYKTKINDKGAVQEYYFDQDKLIKVQYTLINSKEDLVSVWETFKQVESSINTNYKTKSEDIGKRKLIDEDTKAEMKKIARGSSRHDIKWQDSLTKTELVVFSFAMNPRTIINILPQKIPERTSASSISSSSETKEKQSPTTKNEKITIKRSFGKSYYYQGQKLNHRDLYNLTLNVPESYTMMYNSKRDETIASVIGAIGGAMFGYNFAQAFLQSAADYEPTVGLIGLGLIGVSVSFDIGGDKKRYKGVRIYNSKVN